MHDARTRHSAIHTLTATGSLLYLLASFVGAAWFLFDTWVGSHALPRAFGYAVGPLASPDYHTVVAAVVGGSIGGVINGLRSILRFSEIFDSRHVWKYVSAPWMGAALSLLTYSLLATTASVLGGQPVGAAADGASNTTPQLLSNFAVGALAGYGAKDAFIWLDAQVHKLFAVQPAPNAAPQPKALALAHAEPERAEAALAGMRAEGLSNVAMFDRA